MYRAAQPACERGPKRYRVTTAIPCVNGAPPGGHALELIPVDGPTGFHNGDDVRSRSGTDANALENVPSAEAAATARANYVAMVSENFHDAQAKLDITFDDIMKTGVEPQHQAAVEKTWKVSEASGDVHRRSDEGVLRRLRGSLH